MKQIFIMVLAILSSQSAFASQAYFNTLATLSRPSAEETIGVSREEVVTGSNFTRSPWDCDLRFIIQDKVHPVGSNPILAAIPATYVIPGRRIVASTRVPLGNNEIEEILISAEIDNSGIKVGSMSFKDSVLTAKGETVHFDTFNHTVSLQARCAQKLQD